MLGLSFLSLDVRIDDLLGIRQHDVGLDGLLLAIAITPTDALIILFIAIRQPNKHHAGAMLKVHTESRDGGLRYQHPHITRLEPIKGLCLRLSGLLSLDQYAIGYCGRELASLIV